MTVKIKIDKEKCKGCELCVSVCRKDVIEMSAPRNTNDKGYRFAKIVNSENCTACANCAIICADVCIEIKKGENDADIKSLVNNT